VKVEYAPDEISLMRAFVKLIKEFDPDIIVGYEIQLFSLGLLVERAQVLDILSFIQHFSIT